MKRDEVYLKHILDAIKSIEQYLDLIKNHDQFLSKENKMIRDAVVRQLEIIGEAAKNLSEKIKEKENTLPWKEIAGMRDKLIHEYFEVDLEIVWSTVKDDLPPLKNFIEKMLNGQQNLSS
ncbi:MAG: DUF86 domain-containing protein [Candidatus Vogelbacteria bacterium]|nr:DUF86 domain-containing protein [Candidatus Vogelbacteria bacterium]